MAAIAQQLSQTINVTGLTPDILTFTPVTITPGNAMMVVFQSYWPSGFSATYAGSISDGVNTWANVARFSDGIKAQMEIWQTTNPNPTLSAGTVTISWAFVNMIVAAHLFELSGACTRGGPVDNVATGTGIGATTSFSMAGGTPRFRNELFIGAIGTSSYTADITGNVTVSGVSFTGGSPTASYPAATTTTTEGNPWHVNLHTDALLTSGDVAQTYAGTLSQVGLHGWFAAVIGIRPPFSGDFLLVL